MEITGAKGGGGSGSSDKGENRGTEIASVAYMKILLALTEGEAAGGFSGKDIYLDGTPLLDDSGNANFPGVTWEWRSGTVDQPYISGFPAVENEVAVSTELKYGTPWVKSINNTQLSAVRLRLKFPNGLYELRDSGGRAVIPLSLPLISQLMAVPMSNTGGIPQVVLLIMAMSVAIELSCHRHRLDGKFV